MIASARIPKRLLPALGPRARPNRTGNRIFQKSLSQPVDRRPMDVEQSSRFDGLSL